MRDKKRIIDEFAAQDMRILAYPAQDMLCILYICGGRIVRLDCREEGGLYPGDIYMARIEKYQPGIDACFADIGLKQPVFLPGRHKAGEELPLRIVSSAYMEKLPKASDKLPGDMADAIRKKAAHAVKGAKLHAAEDILTLSLKALAAHESAKWLTEDQALYERAKARAAEGHGERVLLHEDENISLCELYGLRTKLARIFSPRVKLDSGAELVFAETEALCAVDVNSAQAIKGKNKEEEVLRLNLEAADELAAQLRVRGISGMILVDFINMKYKESETILLKHLNERMGELKPPVKVEDITKLGIVELSRQRTGGSIRSVSKLVNSTILTNG